MITAEKYLAISNLAHLSDLLVPDAIDQRGPSNNNDEDDLGIDEAELTAALMEAPTVQPQTAGKDWAAAITMVHEAAEAFRIGKEREKELEQEAAEHLRQHHTDVTTLHAQLRRAQTEIDAANERIMVLEQSLAEATQWLNKLAGTISANFKNLNRSS